MGGAYTGYEPTDFLWVCRTMDYAFCDRENGANATVGSAGNNGLSKMAQGPNNSSRNGRDGVEKLLM
jgi:hypothetical protein